MPANKTWRFGVGFESSKQILKMKHGWLVGVGAACFLLTFVFAVLAVKVAGISPDEGFKKSIAIGCFGSFGVMVFGLLMVFFFPNKGDSVRLRGSQKLLVVGFAIGFVGVSLGAMLKDDNLMNLRFYLGGIPFVLGILKVWKEQRGG